MERLMKEGKTWLMSVVRHIGCKVQRVESGIDTEKLHKGMEIRMNQLQQEIKNFHENLRPVLENILEQYGRKVSPNIYHTIIKRCKQLIQKCSFTSLSDTGSLCSLAYWLYIYGHKELALEICEHTHGVDFEF